MDSASGNQCQDYLYALQFLQHLTALQVVRLFTSQVLLSLPVKFQAVTKLLTASFIVQNELVFYVLINLNVFCKCNSGMI